MSNQTNVKFLHYRYLDPSAGNAIDPRGGATVAYTIINDEKIRFAVAKCSAKDNFNRNYGRIRATGKLSSRNQRDTFEGPVDDFIEQMDSEMDFDFGYARR